MVPEVQDTAYNLIRIIAEQLPSLAEVLDIAWFRMQVEVLGIVSFHQILRLGMVEMMGVGVLGIRAREEVLLLKGQVQGSPFANTRRTDWIGVRGGVFARKIIIGVLGEVLDMRIGRLMMQLGAREGA